MQRWSEISSDPNSPAVIAQRRADVIAAGGKPLVRDRVDYLCSLASGKDVLDVGVVEHTRQAVENPNWLHRRLHAVAKQCMGIDVLEEEVGLLRSRGFDVLCHDLTKGPLEKTFDLIVCGELLEHLDAPGTFLNHAVQMLRPHGHLVVSVPNPWYINVILKNIHRSSVFVDSVDHVTWFDPWTLSELAARNNLELISYAGIATSGDLTARAKLLFALQPFFRALGFRHELFAKSLLYEFRVASPGPMERP